MDSLTIEASNASQVADTSRDAASYLPEPAVTGVGAFRDVVDAVTNVAGSVGTGLLAGAGVGGFESLIMLQLQAQEQMQTTSMVSNIEKSKHETSMSPIRNIRVG